MKTMKAKLECLESKNEDGKGEVWTPEIHNVKHALMCQVLTPIDNLYEVIV